MSTDDPEPQGATRRYNAPKRAARALETRRRIRAAAEALFLRDGYARTRMIEIARAAGVAEKTVYLAFPTKAALLDEIIVTRIRDDGSARPFGARRGEILVSRPDELLEQFADEAAGLMTRAARVMALGEAAAPSDPQLAEHRERAHASMRAEFGAIAASLARRDALCDGMTVEVAAATIYALVDTSVYLRLVDGCGWPPDRYRAWLAGTLRRTLLAP
jgi:AcrR family transcriptional regulator